MTGSLKRVAMVAMHTSPTAAAGTGDAGGMNIVLLSIAGQLASRGVEVELLTRAVSAPAVTVLAPGVTLHELAAGPPGPLPKEKLVDVADEFGEAIATLAGRTSARYDLIHAHYWLSGLAALPVTLELGLPFVQSFHTVGAMKNRNLARGDSAEPELRIRTETYLANQANAIVAASAAEANSLIDDAHAPVDRIWVIPPGVDVQQFTPRRAETADRRVRERFAIAADRPIIVVVGRVQPLKDQELAVRALAELHAMRGWSPMMIIAGEATPGGDDYAASLHAIAAEVGVLDDVRFVGALPRDVLADLLSVATLTLVPSHSETFGLVVLESAASGTPVVGFKGTGLLESVVDGESGVLVDSRDPRAWAEVISGLLDDEPRLGALSASARLHAEGFTWGVTAAAMLGVYSSLL